MSKSVEEIESEVACLTQEQLIQFRAWFVEFDGAGWDQQIEEDAALGRLDPFANAALKEHSAARTQPL